MPKTSPKLIDYSGKLQSFYRRHRRLPSYREMLSLFGYRSTNAVARRVARLIEDGVLRRDSTGKLAPADLWGSVKVLGTVAAGFPTGAEEDADTMTIDEYLIHNRESSYLLKVSGDSMIDAGICPGDLVIAERGGKPHEGDIVIAEIDGEWTMKYYRLKRGRPCLEAANQKYPLFVPDQELTITAIVRGVVRKYR